MSLENWFRRAEGTRPSRAAWTQSWTGVTAGCYRFFKKREKVRPIPERYLSYWWWSSWCCVLTMRERRGTSQWELHCPGRRHDTRNRKQSCHFHSTSTLSTSYMGRLELTDTTHGRNISDRSSIVSFGTMTMGLYKQRYRWVGTVRALKQHAISSSQYPIANSLAYLGLVRHVMCRYPTKNNEIAFLIVSNVTML